jgi:hypothetical protein
VNVTLTLLLSTTQQRPTITNQYQQPVILSQAYLNQSNHNTQSNTFNSIHSILIMSNTPKAIVTSNSVTLPPDSSNAHAVQ